jgi:hypothetical protein
LRVKALAGAIAALVLLVVIVVLGLSTVDRFVRGRPRFSPADAPAEPAQTVDRSAIYIDVLNGCEEPGLGERVAGALRRGGFDVIGVGNTSDPGFDETVIIDRVGKEEYRREVAGYLGCENVILERRTSSLTSVTVVVGRDHRMLRLDGGLRSGPAGRK